MPSAHLLWRYPIMGISSIHPHDAHMTELKYLGIIIFLCLCLIGIILFLGAGGQVHSGIPGVSTWEMFKWNIPKIALFAIPSAVTVAVGMSAMVTNSTFYEHWFSKSGYTPGETTFAVLGIWIGAAWAMSVNPDGQMMYTRQELTCIASGFGTLMFSAIAILTRPFR